MVEPNGIQVTPDGQAVLISCGNPTGVMLYDPETLTPRRHTGHRQRVAVSARGRSAILLTPEAGRSRMAIAAQSASSMARVPLGTKSPSVSKDRVPTKFVSVDIVW